MPLAIPSDVHRQFVQGRGEARGRKLQTEARTRQLTSFARQGRGSRAEDEAGHEAEISRPKQGGDIRLL